MNLFGAGRDRDRRRQRHAGLADRDDHGRLRRHVRRAAARSGGRRLHGHAERGRDHAHARGRHAGAVHDGAARDPVPQHRRRPRRPQRRHREPVGRRPHRPGGRRRRPRHQHAGHAQRHDHAGQRRAVGAEPRRRAPAACATRRWSSGTNSVTEPKVTRTIDFRGNSTDPDGLGVRDHGRAGGGRRDRAGRPDHARPPRATCATSRRSAPVWPATPTATRSPTARRRARRSRSRSTWPATSSTSPTRRPRREDGTAARPFDTLADAIAVTGGHPIHIRRAPGDGTLTGRRHADRGDKLLGEGVALTSAQVGAAGRRHAVRRRNQARPDRVGRRRRDAGGSTEVAGLSDQPGRRRRRPRGHRPGRRDAARDADITDTRHAGDPAGHRAHGTGGSL